jgi:hypothetical protein
VSNVAWQACLRKPTLKLGAGGVIYFIQVFFEDGWGLRWFIEVSVAPEDYVHTGAVPLRAFVSELAAM